MDAPALIPAALYGLRTWRPASDERGEYLTGAYDPTPWPDGGAWMHARCASPAGHAAPDAGCACGIHAWHPDAAAARRVLAARRDIPGVVEAAGVIEVHADGFRAERARPHALVATPGRNRGLTARLAERYGAELVEVDGPGALLAWCRERGLGLDDVVVARLLGPEVAAQRRAARARRRRRDVLRGAVALAAAGTLLGVGLVFVNGPHSSDGGVYGRTGWIVCPDDAAGQGGAPPRPPDC